jgi:hypothetical protein
MLSAISALWAYSASPNDDRHESRDQGRGNWIQSNQCLPDEQHDQSRQRAKQEVGSVIHVPPKATTSARARSINSNGLGRFGWRRIGSPAPTLESRPKAISAGIGSGGGSKVNQAGQFAPGALIQLSSPFLRSSVLVSRELLQESQLMDGLTCLCTMHA